VRVISDGEFNGRKTSIVASNYDPDLVATEKEKEMIAADLLEVGHKMVSTGPSTQVSSHPPNFDFSNKYIRLKSGLYMGTIGRISKYATTSPYSVRILDMPGLKPNRHTTCTPCSIELQLDCTAEELIAMENDRVQMEKIQRKSIQAHSLPPSILASLPAPAPCRPPVPILLPSHHLLAPTAASTSAPDLNQPFATTSTTTSTADTTSSSIPSSSSSSIPSSAFSSSSSSSYSSSSSQVDGKKGSHVGTYVRLLSGMYRNSVGRVSSQTPKSESELRFFCNIRQKFHNCDGYFDNLSVSVFFSARNVCFYHEIHSNPLSSPLLSSLFFSFHILRQHTMSDGCFVLL
jgi:hypothetical protein